MSVLLVGVEGERGEAIVRRLISQGDEVRVIEGDEKISRRWRSLGAHVARPDFDMADLVERAAQNVRTLVIGDAVAADENGIVPILQGAKAAGVERIVLYDGRPKRPIVDAVRASSTQYVVMAVGRSRRVLGTGGVGAEDLAEAVDAADDLGGDRRLELDLSEPDAWATLGCG